jgi:anti-sigma-K factor RskA
VIRLKISGLAGSGKNDFYEAWLMDPKNGFISLGTFRIGEDGSTTLDLPVPVETTRFPVVDISLQPANGKPTHSGISVLRGTLN